VLFRSSIEAVKAGLGFAFIPEDKVSALLASGELVVPRLAIAAERHLTINLVLADQGQAGPAARELNDILYEMRDR